MKNLILSKGKVLSKKEQKNIHGGASSSGGVGSSYDLFGCGPDRHCRGRNRVCRNGKCIVFCKRRGHSGLA